VPATYPHETNRTNLRTRARRGAGTGEGRALTAQAGRGPHTARRRASDPRGLPRPAGLYGRPRTRLVGVTTTWFTTSTSDCERQIELCSYTMAGTAPRSHRLLALGFRAKSASGPSGPAVLAALVVRPGLSLFGRITWSIAPIRAGCDMDEVTRFDRFEPVPHTARHDVGVAGPK
jgi:hypothetical protein